jgi:hypothetical protein
VGQKIFFFFFFFICKNLLKKDQQATPKKQDGLIKVRLSLYKQAPIRENMVSKIKDYIRKPQDPTRKLLKEESISHL